MASSSKKHSVPGFFVHPGASEHYVHADAYEERYQARTEDVDFYCARVKPGASVLEYGAGAGRLSLRLLDKGAHVTALDLSEPMLALLKQRAADRTSAATSGNRKSRGRLHAVVADMRTYRDRKRYDVAIAAFHTVCHLYSNADMRAFLHCVGQQLKPGGRLLFDLPLPRIDMHEYDGIAGVRVTEMDGPNGPELLTQRWYQPAEIAMHLDYAGFVRVQFFADFTSEPVDRETSVVVVSAYKAHAH